MDPSTFDTRHEKQTPPNSTTTSSTSIGRMEDINLIVVVDYLSTPEQVCIVPREERIRILKNEATNDDENNHDNNSNCEEFIRYLLGLINDHPQQQQHNYNDIHSYNVTFTYVDSDNNSIIVRTTKELREAITSMCFMTTNTTTTTDIDTTKTSSKRKNSTFRISATIQLKNDSSPPRITIHPPISTITVRKSTTTTTDPPTTMITAPVPDLDLVVAGSSSSSSSLSFLSDNDNDDDYFSLSEENETKRIHSIMEQELTRSNYTSLNLYHKQLGDRGIQIVIDYIKRYGYETNILRLLLGKNDIGDQGCQLLGEYLSSFKTNTNCRVLNVNENAITATEFQYLAKGLKTNSHLLYLILSWNYIGNEGCYELADVLKKNNTLENIDLLGNDIDAKGAFALCNVLETDNTTLRYIKFSNEPIINSTITDKENPNKNSIIKGQEIIKKIEFLTTLNLCGRLDFFKVIQEADNHCHLVQRIITLCNNASNHHQQQTSNNDNNAHLVLSCFFYCLRLRPDVCF